MTQIAEVSRSSTDRSRKGMGVLLWIALTVMMVAMAPRAWSQDSATIDGNVADASGAVVANATVTLTDIGTGVKREATTNEAGAFHFGNIAAATYTMTATAKGFESYTRTGIEVHVAQHLEENAVLAIGSESQTISVQADALQVQTETSEVSTLISGEQVRQLATNGRNVVQLAALGLGVSNQLAAFGGIDALTSSNGLSFNGQRTTHNVYLIDGGEQNDRGCGGCFMNLPSQDAIGEFQTLGSNYSADYGIGSGGTIVMMIKSGQRQYHGTLYEFNRNTDYNANDYFLKQANPPKGRPTFQLNEPGGNIGGPLFIPHVYNEAKNKTFFFVNEEWRRLIQGSAPSVSNTIWGNNFPTLGQDYIYTPQGSTVPVVPNLPLNTAYTAAETAAGLTPGSPFPAGPTAGTYRIPVALVDQNMVRELNAGVFPHPNTTCTGPGGACKQLVVSINQPENIREDVVRIDHSFNSKFQLMGHYLHDAMQKTFFPPLWAGGQPTVGTIMQNPSYTAAIKLTQTYSSSLLNETAFFYSGNKINLTPIPGAGVTIAQPAGWNSTNNTGTYGTATTSLFPTNDQSGLNHAFAAKAPLMPAIALTGTPLSATYTPSYYPWKNGYEGFQYRDDLSWIKGRHQFKFGFSLLHDYKNQELQAETMGRATFSQNNFAKDGIVNAVLGLEDSWNQLEYLYGKHWVNNNYSGYAIDNWHYNSRLTLNLGLRYDGLPHAWERYNKFANFVPSTYNTTLPNPLNSDGSLNPAQLTSYSGVSPTGGAESFYLNGINEARVNGFPRGNVKNYYFTWQPRIGFTYDLSGSGRTVLRGGVGVFYERVQGNDVYNAALNPPFAYQPAPTNVFFSNPSTSIATGATSHNLFPSGLTTIKYNYPPPGTMDWSFGIQHQVAPSIVATVQYVGSGGWDQNNDRQINELPLTNNPSNPWSTANSGGPNYNSVTSTDPRWLGGPSTNPYTDRYASQSGKIPTNQLRTYAGFGTINQEENETNSHYHSLQAGVRFENKWGLTSQLAYTYSHLIDSTTGDLGGLANPFNAHYTKGSGSFDRRQIFNMSYVYALPFAKHTSNMAVKTIIGGWGISGVTVFETGLPNNIVYNGTDTLGFGGGNGVSNRPNLVGKVSYPKKQAAWFSTSSYADPVAPWFGGPNQGYGNAGKDNVVGPGLNNTNLTLTKNIALSGKDNGMGIELRFESFNTFNKAQFGSNTGAGFDTNSHDGNFGQVTQIFSPRILELGGKFHF
ncbi:MAG TPA: TonB-dependent receptor [Terracidiphilus sp.]|nr:TonB-dependent receptor [Terracidiphilus sp.]